MEPDMAYPFSDEHQLIRESARGWLSTWYNAAATLPKIHDGGLGVDLEAWADFAGGQGFAAISIPEAYGGAGLGQLGRAVIMEEIGYHLFASPFFSTCCLAADLIEAFADEATKAQELEAIARGAQIIAFADGRSQPTGRVDGVLDASVADKILLALPEKGAVALYLLPASQFDISQNKTMDGLRNHCSIAYGELDGAALTQCAAADFDAVLCLAQAALVHESVGGAQHCLDITLDYTAQRVQFDRPIASFQAVKHRCADMYIALESARSAALNFAVAETHEAHEAAIIARAWCHESYFKIASDAIQLHGGIGFTWDYPLHYFFKRSRHNRALYGTPQQDYLQLAQYLTGTDG
jgi:alkylation response protein AidB-like acyl-CoA dehydrogenase